MTARLIVCAALVAALSLRAGAQTTPTGTIAGRVTDEQGLAVPGARVTAASPALQGTRHDTTTTNGDYILPLLPPGDYVVTIELEGFATAQRSERVRIGETIGVDVTMRVNTMSETVTVAAPAPTDVGQGAMVSTALKADLVERLPLSRTLVGTVLLAPGVQGTGPSGNIMVNGAMSFESLYLVNGVVVNENMRGQPNTLFIEDAVQETTIKTGAISAEYGRFQGGVVEAITKSGGNTFSGSYRMTLDNDDWTALTDFAGDSRTDRMLYTHEATLGGPLLRDRLWFFGAGRSSKRETSSTTTLTAVSYPNVRDQQRYEGKITAALHPKHTVKIAHTRIDDTEDGNAFLPILDKASLVNRETPQDLLSTNYSAILSSRFFLEGQYSRRQFTFRNQGAMFTDPIKGTLMIDQAHGNARFWSPTFCGVCGDEERDNQNVSGKATYFASTSDMGAHTIVVGVDVFDDKRLANNHQSGSDYRILATSTIIQGETVYPIFDSKTIIQWNPLLTESQGNRFRTISAYVNDSWAVGPAWTVSLGLRYDKNDGIDQAGNTVVKDGAFSPRVSAVWDPHRKGAWTVRAAFGKYVGGLVNSAGDSASSAGNPATFQFDYLGPVVNTGTPASPLTTEAALQVLWNWFNANGGTNRTPRGAPVIPGVNTRIGDRLHSPAVYEYVLGVSTRLGTRGSLRLDATYRDYRDFYATRVDRSTGRVADQFGRQFDLRFTENTNDVERRYAGLSAQGQFRVATGLVAGANYTLSRLEGNVEGETGPNGPLPAGNLIYPEYVAATWAFPVGDLLGDVRHKARAYVTWELPIGDVLGHATLGGLQSFSSGTHYGASGPIDTRPYVTNPGYATPPATATYFFTERDAFTTADVWRTDLAFNWSRRVGLKRAEVFFRGTVMNVFNRQEITNFFDTCGTGGCISTTVQTASNATGLAAFNPFAGSPVEGVHWRKSSTFGQPLSRFAYQTPRTWQCSFGVRF